MTLLPSVPNPPIRPRSVGMRPRNNRVPGFPNPTSIKRRGARLRLATPPLEPPRVSVPRAPDLVLVTGCRRSVVALGQTLRLGGGPEVDVRVDGRHVSSMHASVERVNDGLILRDLGSTNGCWVGGRRVTQATLAAGDVIVLGRTPVLVATTVALPRDMITAYTPLIWRGIVAAAPSSLETLTSLAQASTSKAPVWLGGASGTGKEGAAAAIHGASDRRDGPYVRLNCAALPEALAEAALFGTEQGGYTGARKRTGAFRGAHGGTLLLDEVGELSLAVQAKLLRVLETGEVQTVGSDRLHRVDVRVIASTWRDLEAEAAAGRFRFDLLQRLGALRVELPPLAHRAADIAPLIARFLDEGGWLGLYPDRVAMATLRSARWAGNVRELRNAVQRVITAGSWASVIGSLGAQSAGRGEVRKMALEGASRKHVAENAIRISAGNRANAARLLGISRSTLYRWLARTG